MPKRMDVGRSGWRTQAKHKMLNQLIGQEVGASRYLPKAPHRLVWYDLTAGDAEVPMDDGEWHRSCSPGVLAYHASKSPIPVAVFLHEINPDTHVRLLANLEERLPGFGFTRMGEQQWSTERAIIRVFNKSGSDASIDMLRRSDAVFLINDPNAITEWAMRPTFSREISARSVSYFRGFTTMGCNASGLKRSKGTRRGRIELFDRIAALQHTLPRYRDLCFAPIIRDRDQWAYLVETSDKWRPKTEDLIRSAFKKYGRDATVTWYRNEEARFRGEMLRLFLTQAELKGIRGQEKHWVNATLDERIEMISAFEDAPVPLPPEQMGFWAIDDEETPA
ncbi:hypothetical protein OG436_39535 (plasmid) [Streptomyces caniferus]|uniref:hypothetical protein n=1 Tax=Streptomyces caniferus TaxID=285557 RepID=UPI002E28465E|nr:hypothetical protein [Streptomyces caniferus]